MKVRPTPIATSFFGCSSCAITLRVENSTSTRAARTRAGAATGKTEPRLDPETWHLKAAAKNLRIPPPDTKVRLLEIGDRAQLKRHPKTKNERSMRAAGTGL